MPIHPRLLPTFSSTRFSVSGFMLMSFLKLNFVQGDKYGSICILLHADIQCEKASFVEVAIFSTVYLWLLYKVSGVHRYVDLCLGLQFYSINQDVCF